MSFTRQAPAMIVLFALLFSFAAHQDSPALRDIVARAQANFERNSRIADRYTYKERQVRRYLDSEGRTVKTESVTYDVIYIEGTPWKRLIARNAQPLSPTEERREQQRVEEEIRKRQGETPEQRAKRLREFEKKKQEREQAAREVLDAFEFFDAGRETMAGLRCLVIEAIPRPDYKGHGRMGRILKNLSGYLWITTDGEELVRFEATVAKSISFGWFLAKLEKGTSIQLEERRVNDEVWLPSRFSLKLSYRKLFSTVNIEQENEYFDYRKFTVESKILP